MRPGRLTVRAFGPYADAQTVDFDALRDDGLFLIHGATGSGKTFLLDALSFALYGEVSGGRSVASLRSDHAAPAAEPLVALEFDAQGERWLVERVPPHQRLGLRAGTVVDKPARAVLSRAVGGSWSPEATGVKEVGLRVGELMGLTAKQFRQVIVLPQGRFEEVLLATSDKREDLLKTLFDSVLFESVSLHLDRRAREAADAIDRAAQDLVHLRRQADERWAEVADGTVDPVAPADDDGPSVHVLPPATDHQVHLDQLAARAAARAADVAVGAERAETVAADAARAASSAEALDGRHRRRNQLLAARAELHAAGPTIAAARTRLGRALAADGIRPALERATAAERAHRAATAAVADRSARLVTSAGAASAPTPSALASLVALLGGSGAVDHTTPELADARRDAHDALTVRRAKLDDLVAVAERRSTLVTRAAAAERDADQLGHGAERARFELAGLAVTEDDLRVRLRAADDAAAQLDGVEAAAQVLAGRARAAALLADAHAAVERSRAAHATADEQLHEAAARSRASRAAHLDGIAAVLAGHLANGEACLVCGGTEHPRPAVAHPGAVSAEDVAADDERLEAARRAERGAAAAVARAESALAARRHEAGPAAADPDGALREAEAAIALVSSTAAVAATGGDLLDQLDALDLRRRDLTAQIDTDAPRAAAARREAASLRAQADTDDEQLEHELGGTTLDLARTEADRLLAAVDDLDQAAERAARSAPELALAEAELAERVAASPFADRAEAAAALVDAEARHADERSIAHHDQQVAAIDAQLALPELVHLELQGPALEPLRDAAADTRAAARTAGEDRARWSAAAEAIARLAERHRTLDHDHHAARQQAEVLVRVADQCMGRLGDKVSLQRWVLATYLEEICELATRRLQTMTSHRYSLRVHRERAARGARSGLDLRVFDAHTGEERAVQSLSGGETFQASLALALAVADSVQQHAGGVHLDALFVDEGFGTLDPHSLELAIDELDRLRAGGRTVGIISHVAALRDRIRVGIEVTASTHGSSIRVGEIAAA